MLTVTINGVKTKVKPGQRLIQTIRGAGVPVPTMCYHPDIATSGGRCRVCVCKVDGRLVTPCNADVKEGMDIVTNTPELVQLRKEAQALLPQAQQDAPFPVIADTIPLKTASKYILRRPELCTNCNLCVQMCREVQGVSAIASIRHDHHLDGSVTNTISAFHDASLPETECISCGQCINVCPTGALSEVSEIALVEKAMSDPSILTVVQFAPAVRVALAEEFGCAPGTRSLTHEMVTATRRLSSNVRVFDTNFTADLTIVEEGYELLERLRRVLTGRRKYGPEHMETALPMITSCSPGWINHCERSYPDLLPHLSSCKSPMEMAGALVKHVYPSMAKVDPHKICSVAVMPCVAKKSERDRDQLKDASGVPDVDYVLTTREFARLLKKHHIDPTMLPKEPFDDPFGIASGAGLIFGATGGVMEAALRTAYEVVTGRTVPFAQLAVTPVRGMDGVKEATLKIEHCKEEWEFLEGVELKVAVAHGIANAKKVMDRVRERKAQGEVAYHFIEIMACPGGCLGGGGQPKPTSMEIKVQRAKLIYAEDGDLPLRKSHENPAVRQLYQSVLQEPLGHVSHELLHTHYRAVETEAHPLLATADAQATRNVLAGYPRYSRKYLTNMMADVVDALGCVSDAAIVAMAEHIGTTPVDVESVLSHYHYFPRKLEGSGTVVYLCDCANCRAKGSRQIRMELLRRGIPFHLTSWLGWCVNGAPAAFVRHRGDPNLHPLLDIQPDDARWANVVQYKNPELTVRFPVRSMKRFSKDGDHALVASCLENVKLSPEDAAFLASKAQCPVSRKAFEEMTPELVIAVLKDASLRGCGGAGFPTFFKWDAVRKESSARPKYVVVNADEGLPCTFKDYYLLHNPFTRMRMLSGMSIAAHTVGASACVMYLRYEYRNLVPALRQSFERYRKLNPRVSPNFSLDIVVGGGPYICGEETALFESVEGHAPQARCTRTIFPTHQGLFGAPTLVGNVETFAWIPSIVYHGPALFANASPCGAPSSKGVKLFSISGDVPQPMLAEFPLGTPLRSVLTECAGLPMEEIAAVEVGGMLEPLTMPADFDKPLSLDGSPAALPGGGSIVVYSKARFQPTQIYQAKAKFSHVESCQLCAPCREGTKLFSQRVDDMLSGKIPTGEAVHLQEAFHAMELASNCGHGKGCGKLARQLLDASIAK